MGAVFSFIVMLGMALAATAMVGVILIPIFTLLWIIHPLLSIGAFLFIVLGIGGAVS